MKPSRVFWQHLILWTGALVGLSLLARIVPGYSTTWLGLRHYRAPYTAALLERIAAGITIAALPAGMAASAYLMSWRATKRADLARFAVSPFAIAALVFMLVGFVAPYTARSEYPNPMPRRAANTAYYSFDELLSASADFRAQANLGVRTNDARKYNPVARAKSESLKQRFYFIIMWSIAPILLAWIGVLVRHWSSLMSRQAATLAEWLVALVLLLSIQLTTTGTTGWEYAWYGGSPMMTSGTGRGIMMVPAVVLIALAWTTAVAQRALRVATK